MGVTWWVTEEGLSTVTWARWREDTDLTTRRPRRGGIFSGQEAPTHAKAAAKIQVRSREPAERPNHPQWRPVNPTTIEGLDFWGAIPDASLGGRNGKRGRGFIPSQLGRRQHPSPGGDDSQNCSEVEAVRVDHHWCAGSNLKPIVPLPR